MKIEIVDPDGTGSEFLIALDWKSGGAQRKARAPGVPAGSFTALWTGDGWDGPQTKTFASPGAADSELKSKRQKMETTAFRKKFPNHSESSEYALSDVPWGSEVVVVKGDEQFIGREFIVVADGELITSPPGAWPPHEVGTIRLMTVDEPSTAVKMFADYRVRIVQLPDRH